MFIRGSTLNKFLSPAMAEHHLVGTMHPRCACCGRGLIWIVTHPGVPCRAATLPFDELTPAPAKADLRPKETTWRNVSGRPNRR